MVWRRLSVSKGDPKHFWMQTFDGGDQSIAGIVRASAAFPGIPPRRVSMPDDPNPKFPAGLPKVAFLADGGLWNNLGTQVLREDRFLGRYGELEDGVLRPYFSADGFGIPLLCYNGSAQLRPSHPFVYRVPGLALAMSLFRVAGILSANTVTPRVDAMRKEFRRRTLAGERPSYRSPADLVADLRPLTPQVLDELRDATWREESIRRSGPPQPTGSYSVPGLGTIADWDRLLDSSAWKTLVAKHGSQPVETATTLDRIDLSCAKALILRGYLNTYLLTLFLAPLNPGDLDRLEDLEHRVDLIVGRR